MRRILVVGSLNMDIVIETPCMPKAGETIAGKSIAQIPGGKRRESYRIRQTESWRTERPHNMLQSFRTTWKRILPNIAI